MKSLEFTQLDDGILNFRNDCAKLWVKKKNLTCAMLSKQPHQSMAIRAPSRVIVAKLTYIHIYCSINLIITTQLYSYILLYQSYYHNNNHCPVSTL